MTEMPMGDMSNLSSASSGMPDGMSNKSNNMLDQDSNNAPKKEKDAEQIAVEKGADLALQANGIPPPASTMIGEKVGEKYKEAKEGMDIGKNMEKGLNTTLAAADIMSKGAEPKEAADGVDAAKKGMQNTMNNIATLGDNPAKETLTSASQPTEKQSVQAEESMQAEQTSNKRPGMGR
jgi:hypothetical protein